MYHHDYTQELGLISPEKRVSRPVAAAILAAVAVAAYFGGTSLRESRPDQGPAAMAGEKPGATDAVPPAGGLAQAHHAPISGRP